MQWIILMAILSTSSLQVTFSPFAWIFAGIIATLTLLIEVAKLYNK